MGVILVPKPVDPPLTSLSNGTNAIDCQQAHNENLSPCQDFGNYKSRAARVFHPCATQFVGCAIPGQHEPTV